MKDTSQPKPQASVPADHATAMPAYVDRSHLVVSDLETVSSWYQRIIGLSPIEANISGVTLGVAGRPLLTLTSDGNAVRAPRNAPGLFHHAFLVPDRTELGRWLVHAAESGVQLQEPPITSSAKRSTSPIRRVTESRSTAIDRARNGTTERTAWWQ